MGRKGLLDSLNDGLVIGDGGFLMALEKRGYVTAGPWTSEAAYEFPEAVRQLHREFLRSGSDVMQVFTYYSSDDKLKYGNNELINGISCFDINKAACILAREVADEGNALVAGGLSPNVAYREGKGKEYIQKQVKIQVDIFVKHKVDFIICESFNVIEEMEWTIEEVRKCNLPLMATMCIGKLGDITGVPIGDCAVRMARAKADVVGLNCWFDPFMTLEGIKLMKDALNKEGLNPFLATQPNGFFTTGTGKDGYLECPEFPLAMESRTITRFDAHKYAVAAYELGVRYIGGCCGFEAYHIRALAEALSKFKGGVLPKASEKHAPWGAALTYSPLLMIRQRASQAHWENMIPHSGRKDSPTYELPSDNC